MLETVTFNLNYHLLNVRGAVLCYMYLAGKYFTGLILKVEKTN